MRIYHWTLRKFNNRFFLDDVVSKGKGKLEFFFLSDRTDDVVYIDLDVDPESKKASPDYYNSRSRVNEAIKKGSIEYDKDFKGDIGLQPYAKIRIKKQKKRSKKRTNK